MCTGRWSPAPRSSSGTCHIGHRGIVRWARFAPQGHWEPSTHCLCPGCCWFLNTRGSNSHSESTNSCHLGPLWWLDGVCRCSRLCTILSGWCRNLSVKSKCCMLWKYRTMKTKFSCSNTLCLDKRNLCRWPGSRSLGGPKYTSQ